MRSNSALEKADRVAADTTVLLASAGEEGIVKLWDTQTAKCVASYNVSGSKSTSNQLTYLAVVGNGNDNLVLCTADARIIILKAKVSKHISNACICHLPKKRDFYNSSCLLLNIIDKH